IPTPAAILENSTTPQTIGLSGITPGVGDSNQVVTVSATSSNPAVVPNPAVTYTSPATIGSLTFAPPPTASGQAALPVTLTGTAATGTLTLAPATYAACAATITITGSDDGGTANGGVNTFSQTFPVVVFPVNQPPATTVIANTSILENTTAPQNVPLVGISPG